ncbi:unnamed protein product [Gongylonema pulchrum]|uniref:TPM_phosphatase domain-containing protein n=1 Tax=Gongylonema pulchrum TaxID=637853 RepID=A0A183DQA6_9BILA|nr:unnamed protein product [Gongylonema pulchrum]
MGRSLVRPLRFLLLMVLILSDCQRVEWDASNFPNPTTVDFKRCNMRTTANICDPDKVLTESQRYRLNHELHQLESRTRQDHAPDFCQKKGITAAMAIVKHVRGGSDATIKEIANAILRKWTLDEQCQKSVVIVVATEDHRFWAARDDRVPVYGQEFDQIFSEQKELFRQGNYPQALGNILQQTWSKALSKQGAGSREPADGRGSGAGRDGFGPPVGPPPPVDIRPQPGGGKHEGLLPKIPFWVWLALILIIIPLLCCCCICYCCFCKKSSSPRRQGPSDIEGAGGVPMGGDGGGRPGGRSTGMNSFLGGLGGAGIGHLASRFLSGGGGGGGLGGLFGGSAGRRGVPTDPDYQGGGAYPAAPFQPAPKAGDYGGGGAGGKGLYPTAAVRDDGGGGGW